MSLLLYLYFIIVSLDASGAMHATKEKPHNHYRLDAARRLVLFLALSKPFAATVALKTRVLLIRLLAPITTYCTRVCNIMSF